MERRIRADQPMATVALYRCAARTPKINKCEPLGKFNSRLRLPFSDKPQPALPSIRRPHLRVVARDQVA
eukprot:scaffold2618_cov240-Pinguiococcus_pyrenoidosus.AAC.8